jgi:hypothetical protein
MAWMSPETLAALVEDDALTSSLARALGGLGRAYSDDGRTG